MTHGGEAERNGIELLSRPLVVRLHPPLLLHMATLRNIIRPAMSLDSLPLTVCVCRRCGDVFESTYQQHHCDRCTPDRLAFRLQRIPVKEIGAHRYFNAICIHPRKPRSGKPPAVG